MQVQLLIFEDCPLAHPARENLKKALATCNIDSFDEIDILEPGTPKSLKDWGSPTILIDGTDVCGHPKGDDISCRYYPGPESVPDVQTIVDRLSTLSAS